MRSLVIVVILCALGFGTAGGQCSEAEKKNVMDLDIAWGKANHEGNRTALIAIYADDYVGFPWMQAKQAAVDGAMATFERDKANPGGADKVVYDHRMVSCTPVTATITHRNTITTPKGETFYTRSVHFLEKRGGRWQVVSNAGNALNDAGVLWYLEHDWSDALGKKDRAWYEKNYAADYTAVDSTSGRLLSKDQAIAEDTDPALTIELTEASGMNIRIDGNAAIVTGIFRIKGKDAKGAFDRRMRFTDTWIKRDGRWQAWATQGTAIVEPQVAKN